MACSAQKDSCTWAGVFLCFSAMTLMLGSSRSEGSSGLALQFQYMFNKIFSVYKIVYSVKKNKINETLVSLACYLISNSWQHMPQRERGTRVMSWNSLKGYNTLNSIDKYYKGNQPMWVWSIWSLFKACWSHFEANIFAMPTDHGLSGDPRGL